MSRITVLAGGTLVDGTGSAARHADVWLQGGEIVRIVEGGGGHPEGLDIVDCTDLAIAPGFIDVHSHADNAGYLATADTSKILQGVTTEVVGNCGISLAPRTLPHRVDLDNYAQRLFPVVDWQGESFTEYWAGAERGLVTNAAPLVGQGTLRIAAMGMENRPPSAAEKAKMRDLLLAAMEAGAFGLSTGLIYPPGSFSETEEIAELAGHMPDGIYASHLRDEGENVERSVAEAIAIGEAAGCQVQLSHHKAAGKANWGRTEATLAMVDAARERGVRIHLDVYPYTVASTVLTSCVPPWAEAGGEAALLQRLEDSGALGRLRRDIEQGLPGWENEIAATGADGIRIASTQDHRFEGSTLAEIAATIGGDGIDALFHVLREERLRASILLFSMTEGDVQRVLRHPLAMIGSDGLPPGLGGRPHPRLYGTFPRVLSRYVREIPVLTLEAAVHKMTGLPAAAFRLARRGVVAEGNMADLVVFRPGSVRDGATFEDPVQAPLGIERVYLGGRAVVVEGRYVGNRQGERLRPTGGLR